MHTLPDLTASIAHEVFATLCASLPPPANDTPESRAARDDAAMAAVAALHPTDALEAGLAADIVILQAYARDSLRLAGEHRDDLAKTLRCRAQATALVRQMRSLLRDYRATQEQRDKALAKMHPAAMERAGYWFRECVVPEPAPAAAPPPAPGPAPHAAPAGPAFETLTEAEQYAVMYPRRAARIRAGRGLPARLDFGPPEPEIVDGLVHGTSPILRALDAPELAAAA